MGWRGLEWVGEGWNRVVVDGGGEHEEGVRIDPIYHACHMKYLKKQYMHGWCTSTECPNHWATRSGADNPYCYKLHKVRFLIIYS